MTIILFNPSYRHRCTDKLQLSIFNDIYEFQIINAFFISYLINSFVVYIGVIYVYNIHFKFIGDWIITCKK